MNAISPHVVKSACIDTASCGSSAMCPDIQQAMPGDLAGGMTENRPINHTAGRGGLRSPSGGRPVGRKNKPRVPKLVGRRWHVFQMVHTDRDRVVQDLIEGESRFGYVFRPPFRIEVPTTAKDITRRGRVETIQVPMFQGYGFVEFDRANDAWQTILSCDGVLRLFSTRTLIPIPLPVGFVEKLIDTRDDRLTVQAIPETPRKAGDALVVTDGPLTSFSAVCKECDGLTTKADAVVFGRHVPLTLPYASFRVA